MMKFYSHIVLLSFLLLIPGVEVQAQKEKANIIFIGNSITEASYLEITPPIVASLFLEGHNYTVRHVNCGVSGMTTYNFLPSGNLFAKVLHAADSIKRGGEPLVFSFMLGTNDSAIKGPTGAPVSPEKYKENLQTIINALHSKYPEAVFVLNRPIWYSPTTHNSAMYLQEGLTRLKSYAPQLKKLAKENPGRVFVGDQEGFEFFRKHYLLYHNPQQGNSGTFYLHPNADGAEKLEELWGKALMKVLKKLPCSATKAEVTNPDEFWDSPRSTYKERRNLFLEYCVEHGEKKQRIGIFTQMCRLLTGRTAEEELVQDAIDKIRSNWDCNDFSLNGLLRLAYMEREKTTLSPTITRNIENCILDFKYWWNDARRDTTYRCYHTENHQALYHTAELLAGQLYKDRKFSSGLTGIEHIQHAEHLLKRWLDFRFRFGFSEWNSSYYEVETLVLLNLYDYAENPEIKEKTRMVLDLLMYDMALGNFHGILATTSGRAYAHSLVTGHHTMSPTLKLVFGEGQYLPDCIMSNTVLAASSYRCPQVIIDIATDYSKPMLNRQKVSIEVDDAEKYGLSWDNEEDTHLFWGMQEFIHPKAIRMSKQISEKHDTYPYRNYDHYIRRYDEQIEKHGKIINPRLDRFALSEANFETYRTHDYMLSCAFDYRIGAIAYQQHIWQASLSNEATVFTTHPGRKDLGGSPNYWGGSAVLPRASQHKNVAICIYNNPVNDGMNLTHAYFPRQAFDEVIEKEQWVFGKKGNGYVALYSQHPTEWQSDKEGNTNDLVVAGRKNVWVCEVGSAKEWGDFNRFVEAISQSPISCKDSDVAYSSPTIGEVKFGWEASFLVNGKEMPLKTDYRYDNPYSQSLFNSHEIKIEREKHRLDLNFTTGTKIEK